ncbi:hypothetical protein CNR22_13135 [Sphingobacteriaceae bacterium]|nr:hypothetical protein CNR22_13135 [Sphingobacteriaceae bacterium]
MSIHLLGIRHHGPGSAKNVKLYLEKIRPDIILLEGPPEAEAILHWAGHKEMKPPVAILAYVPNNLQQALFYPFAEFSPEWQAILYALENKIPLRFMDLPVAHKLAIQGNSVEQEIESEAPGEMVQNNKDPFLYLAEIAGYTDAEKWWENNFEYRENNNAVFDAVSEAVCNLREQLKDEPGFIEKCREAWMRKMLKQAEKEMYNDIAVICGAWHVPALKNIPKDKEDTNLLKNLPKVKVECTWVPWTYSRLSFTSGYGAGINSPGWYHHIWKTKKDISIKWLTKVARLFRKNQIDISSAHIIETVRLAETLSSLRGLAVPGLEELNEATNSVMCMGDAILLSIIHKELIVSPRLGYVPIDAPKTPLQVDIEKTQKQLRLPLTEDEKEIALDLREERDLEKSIFLHRLALMGIKWGVKKSVSGKGTFKEAWVLHWDPAFAIDIIDKALWGNSVEEAGNNFLSAKATAENSLQTISVLLSDTLLSNLPQATETLLKRIHALAAASGDVIQLIEALPPLVNALRYGNVRRMDNAVLSQIVESMITRISISLPGACQAVDEDAAQHLLDLFFQLNDSITLLQNEDQLKQWQETLVIISENKNTATLLAGYATRLLYDFKLLAGEKLQTLFTNALSSVNAYAHTAAWLEGFLKGSGTILLIDENLWLLVETWVKQLSEQHFIEVLPLMRRTFSQFSSPERRKLGEKAKSSTVSNHRKQLVFEIDHEGGMKALPIIMHLLNIH